MLAATALKELALDNAVLQFLRLKNLMIEDTLLKEISKGFEKCPNLFLLDISNNLFNGESLGYLSNKTDSNLTE